MVGQRTTPSASCFGLHLVCFRRKLSQSCAETGHYVSKIFRVNSTFVVLKHVPVEKCAFAHCAHSVLELKCSCYKDRNFLVSSNFWTRSMANTIASLKRPTKKFSKNKSKQQRQCRRKKNLMKKAWEYSRKCDADVCLGIRLRDNGQVHILSADISGFWAFIAQQLVGPECRTVEAS